jgi:hypothetical protein
MPAAMNALYTFLSKRDLSGFSPFKRPPMTEAKQQLIAESETRCTTSSRRSTAATSKKSFAAVSFHLMT